MSVKFYLLLALSLTCGLVSGQYLEAFESQTDGATTFSSNGHNFTISGDGFEVDRGWSAFGYNGSSNDMQYIVNAGLTGLFDDGSTLQISNTSGLFYVKSIYVSISTTGGNLNHGQTVRFTGKKLGTTVFSFTKSTGFVTSFGVQNGYTLIDFSTEPGYDVSSDRIDELEIVSAGVAEMIYFDGFTFDDITLPVELVDFSGSLNPQNNVELNWRTATENNNKKFEIEHSLNGTEFQTIGTLPGHGTTNHPQQYSFIHEQPKPGQNYYRLQQFDMDGRSETSKVVVVSRPMGSGSDQEFFPNPALSSKTMFNYESLDEGVLNVQIFNAIGQVVRSFQTQVVQGENLIAFDLEGLGSGWYLVEFEKDGLFLGKRLLVQ
ncbi:MAG: T9SS type A sorting domain-containing protein [Bacteroidota bacterium]